MFFSTKEHKLTSYELLEVERRIEEAVAPLTSDIAKLQKQNEQLCKIIELHKSEFDAYIEKVSAMFKESTDKLYQDFVDAQGTHEEDHKVFEAKHEKWHADYEAKMDKRHNQYVERMEKVLENECIQAEALVDIAALLRELLHRTPVKKPRVKKSV